VAAASRVIPRAKGGVWRRGPRLLVAAALVVGAVAGLAAPASAHATLESTNPPSGTAVAKSPGQVVLHFDEQVSVTPSSVEVFNSSAKRVDSGTTRHVAGDSHSVETAVPASLPNGGYVVTWRVVSADSHPVHGAFTFFIGTATGSGAVASEASQLLSRSAGSRTVGVAYGTVRFLAYVAVAGLLGALLFAAWVWPAGRDRRAGRAVLWASLAVLAVLTLAAFSLQGVYGGGLGLSAVLKGTVLRSVWATRFGKAYVARLGFLAGLGVLAGWLFVRGERGRRAPAWWLATTAAVSVAMLSSWALGDHASTGNLVWLAVPFDVVHLGAASIWIGGLIMVLVMLVPASIGDRAGPGSPLREAGARFSNIALASVVALVATGLFAAWRQVGLSWGALTTTPYGKLVLYKAGGLAVLVALASISRTAVHGRLALPGAPAPPPPGDTAPPRAVGGTTTITRAAPSRLLAAPRPAAPLSEDGRARRLRGAVWAEVTVGLAVLALSAVLVGAQPAKQAYAAPFSTEAKAGPTLVNLVVSPAHTGPVALHLYILTAAGAIDNVPEVDATMSNPGTGVSGLTVPLHQAGPGHYVAYGFDIPFPGTWLLNATVRTDALNEYFTQPIHVPIR
jgi:copper transport protein